MVVELAEGARDSWCTPSWLCDLLPLVDLDPCSNERSRVRAKMSYCGTSAATDGLTWSWQGLVYVNGPYSNLLPWAEKLRAEYRHITGAGFLVNTDSSTQWWRVLSRLLPLRLDFNKRIQFEPPPGVKSSTNSKPQTLLMTESFWRECDPEIESHGVLWRRA